MAIFISISTIAQDTDSLSFEKEQQKREKFYYEDKNEVRIGSDELLRVEELDDTVRVKVGNMEIIAIEDGTGTSVKINKSDDNYDKNDKHRFRDKKFKGHWAGFEFGLNNYVNNDFSLALDEEAEFLTLNTAKSWNFNLNFLQYSLGFGTSRAGIVTGFGLEFSNYHFDNDNSIEKFDGELVAKTYDYDLIKNKLKTVYITAPLLIETQLLNARRSRRIYLSAGVTGGLKLFSKTKVKYIQDGAKRKEKSKDDFYLSPFRYGITARAGYRFMKLYCTYYVTPLFINNRAPELHPIALGFAITF